MSRVACMRLLDCGSSLATPRRQAREGQPPTCAMLPATGLLRGLAVDLERVVLFLFGSAPVLLSPARSNETTGRGGDAETFSLNPDHAIKYEALCYSVG